MIVVSMTDYPHVTNQMRSLGDVFFFSKELRLIDEHVFWWSQNVWKTKSGTVHCQWQYLISFKG